MELVFANRREERPRVVEALQRFARAEHLAPSVVQAADLALEEHLTNVLSYAYTDAEAHQLVLRLEVRQGEFVMEIADDGKPFNPLDRPAVDTSIPLEHRPIGGLGIHLLRNVMDEVRYQRTGNQNVLRLKKRLPDS